MRRENSLNWHLTRHHLLEPVKSILSLSFDDLPYRLKYCFLYCSISLEYYLIWRKRLIRLWIAEGFVEHDRGVTSKQVADIYLMELACYKVVEWNKTDRPKSCKMHDLMLELAVSTFEKEIFFSVYVGIYAWSRFLIRPLCSEGSTGSNEFLSMPQLRRLLYSFNCAFVAWKIWLVLSHTKKPKLWLKIRWMDLKP